MGSSQNRGVVECGEFRLSRYSCLRHCQDPEGYGLPVMGTSICIERSYTKSGMKKNFLIGVGLKS